MAEREFLERCRRLREEDQVERAVGPVRKLHLDWDHANLSDRLEGHAVDSSSGIFLHPSWKIADAKALGIRCRIEVETAVYTRHVAGVKRGNGLQHEHGI